MRNYRFRVWDKIAERMVYLDDDDSHHSFIFIRGNAEYLNLQNGSGGDEYEIMQFTGLHDSEGKEIYEGDKLEGLMASGYGGKSTRYKKTKFKVCWNDWMNGWSLILLDATSFRFYPHFSECKIIGNIHEEKSV